MEPDDLLCSRNARPEKALARANGTSLRASGWAGEKAARSGSSISPHPLKRERASLEGSIRSMVVVRCAQSRAASATPFGELWRIDPATPRNVEEFFRGK